VETELHYGYFTGGDTTTTATTTTTTATVSSTDKTTTTLETLRRDVTETRHSVRRLDSHVEELAHDVSVLSTDVRTLLRALHAVLHPDDDRSRPPTSSRKPRLSRQDSLTSSTTLSTSEPSSSRPPTSLTACQGSSLTSSRPRTMSTISEQSSSTSSRPPTSSLTQKKRGSLVDASPEQADPRVRRPLYDDPTRASCPPKDAPPAPAAPPGWRLSRIGSGSSSRDSVVADEVDAETAASEQTYVFTDSGPPAASRRPAGEFQPGVAATTTETGGTVRSRPRTVAAAQWDSSVSGDTLTSSPSASVLLTTDL